MLGATKGYDFTIRFGEETDTLDAEGKVIAACDVRPMREEVEAMLPRFTGEIEQVPPAYSALKIDGKAAYARARAGEEVELRPRRVTIEELRLLSTGANEATFSRHRLKRDLHPLARPRHLLRPWNRRPRLLSKAQPRGPFLP